LYWAFAYVLHFRLPVFSPVSRQAAYRFRIGLLIIQSLCNFISGSICGQTEQIKLRRALEMEWIVLDEKERFSGR
jgi:hypothetical protein